MSIRSEIQTQNQLDDGRYKKVEEALNKMANKMDISSFILQSPSVEPSSPPEKKSPPVTTPRDERMRSPRKAHHLESSPPLSPSKLLRRTSSENTVVVNENSVWYESYTTVEPLPEGVSITRDAEAVKHEFVHILKNIYVNVSPKRMKDVEDDAICTCLSPSYAYSLLEKSHGKGVGEYSREDLEAFARCGCGDRCINRLCYCECNPDTCPCGPECTNQMFRRHRWT